MKTTKELYSILYTRGKLVLLHSVAITAFFACNKKDYQAETKKTATPSLQSSTAVNLNLMYEESLEGSTYFPLSGTAIDKTHNIENCNGGAIAHGATYDWTLSTATNPVFQDTKATRFEIRKDQPRVGSSAKIRSEVTIIKGDDTRFTSDIWYSFAVLFPSVGFEYDGTRDCINQWYEDGSSETTLRCQSDHAFLESFASSSGTSLIQYDLFAPALEGSKSVSSMKPIPKDEWHEFVFHFIHSVGSDGLIEVWRDGVKIHDIAGRNMHLLLPKWKIGLYKASFLDGSSKQYSRVIYFDNIRIGKKGSALADMSSNSTIPTGNVAPTANAGSDVSITLPNNSVSLIGKATDSDGTISSTAWTKISGPAATFTNESTLTPTVSDLTAGTYVFRLTVTDDLGAVTTDEVSVVVSQTINLAPVANAGNDVQITLPVNTVQLSGTATDPDGSISKVNWTKVSGGNYTINNPSLLSPVLTLEAGTYTFRLTATDDLGLSSSNDVTIIVNNEVGTSTGSITSFTLVNSKTEKDVLTINDGATISLKQIATTPKLNIRANPGTTLSNVKFELSGTQTRTYTDSAIPYALMGDNGAGNYYYGNWNPPALGSYTLTATPYVSGVAGTPTTIHFTFVQ